MPILDPLKLAVRSSEERTINSRTLATYNETGCVIQQTPESDFDAACDRPTLRAYNEYT